MINARFLRWSIHQVKWFGERFLNMMWLGSLLCHLEQPWKALAKVELLAKKLKIHMAVHNCTIFMQDGAPCHRSKVAKTFHAENWIKVLVWPGNSPDLNRTENQWTNIKNKVAEKHPSSAKDIVKVIKEVWVKEISLEFFRNLLHSMPRRLQEVIKNGGGSTKY